MRCKIAYSSILAKCVLSLFSSSAVYDGKNQMNEPTGHPTISFYIFEAMYTLGQTMAEQEPREKMLLFTV